MQFTALLLAAIATVTMAVPTADAEPANETRGITSTTFACADANWGGQCSRQTVNLGQCYNFPAGISGKLSSFRSDKNTIFNLYNLPSCLLYSSKAVVPLVVQQADRKQLGWNGIVDLKKVGWGDKAKSVMCFSNNGS